MKVDNMALSSAYQTQMKDQNDSVDVNAFKKKLEDAAKNKDEVKIREAAEQFESFFVNMLFKEMRKTVQEGGLTEKSDARETFEGMLDEEMSKKITEAGGIGLADMMVKNFIHQYEQTAASDETIQGAENSKDIQSTKDIQSSKNSQDLKNQAVKTTFDLKG